MGRAIRRDAAERVLRRAVELNDRDDSDAVAIDAILGAARDLGMDERAVQRALAEEQAGLLTPHDEPIDRLVGPGSLSAARVVPLRPSEAMGLADEWLRKALSFRRARGTEDMAEYRRRTDAVAGVQRASRRLSGQEQAAKIKRLRLAVHPVEGDRTLVALVADLHTSRTAAEAGGGAVATTGSVAAVAFGLAWSPWAWLGIPASAALGASVLVGRREWTKGIDLELESVLDRVARGERPASMLADLSSRWRDAGRRTTA